MQNLLAAFPPPPLFLSFTVISPEKWRNSRAGGKSHKKRGIYPPNEDDSIHSDISACGLRCVISDCDGGWRVGGRAWSVWQLYHRALSHAQAEGQPPSNCSGPFPICLNRCAVCVGEGRRDGEKRKKKNQPQVKRHLAACHPQSPSSPCDISAPPWQEGTGTEPLQPLISREHRRLVYQLRIYSRYI